MVSKMENGHGKVWICLLILVLAAVVIGLLYYTTAAKEPDEEGFLIRASRWSHGEPGNRKTALRRVTIRRIAIRTNEEWGDRIWHLNL